MNCVKVFFFIYGLFVVALSEARIPEAKSFKVTGIVTDPASTECGQVETIYYDQKGEEWGRSYAFSSEEKAVQQARYDLNMWALWWNLLPGKCKIRDEDPSYASFVRHNPVQQSLIMKLLLPRGPLRAEPEWSAKKGINR